MCMKMTLEWFEKYIYAVEENMFVTNSINLQEKWTDLKQESCSVLNVKVKTGPCKKQICVYKGYGWSNILYFYLRM